MSSPTFDGRLESYLSESVLAATAADPEQLHTVGSDRNFGSEQLNGIRPAVIINVSL
jgi:hypothetical protein